MSYDTTNDFKAPETKGFAGGTFYGDNSTTYVGYTIYNASPCSWENNVRVPGYILTNSSAAGVYVQCWTFDVKQTTNNFYLLNHPNLKWIPTNSSNMLNLTSSVKIPGFNDFLFGRIQHEGIYYLGKLQISHKKLYITTKTDSKSFDSGVEVLTCT